MRALFPVLIQYLIHLRARQVLMKIVIHLHRGSPTASADTFHFFERKQTIGRCALVADTKLLLAVRQQLFSTDEHASDIGAHLHVVLSSGLGRPARAVTDV